MTRTITTYTHRHCHRQLTVIVFVLLVSLLFPHHSLFSSHVRRRGLFLPTTAITAVGQRARRLHTHTRTLTFHWGGVARSTQPSILQGMVNEYQPYGWIIIPMAMGECSAYSSLQSDSKIKCAAWPTSWRPPGADRLWPRGTTVNCRTWLAP